MKVSQRARLLGHDDGLMVDLAGYTEVNDRLYIGKKATKAQTRRERGEMGEMIADLYVYRSLRDDVANWAIADLQRGG